MRQCDSLVSILTKSTQIQVLRWIQPDPWALEFAPAFHEFDSALTNLTEISFARLTSDIMELVSTKAPHLRVVELRRFTAAGRGVSGFGWLKHLQHLRALQLIQVQLNLDQYEAQDEDWGNDTQILPFDFFANLTLLELAHFSYPFSVQEIRYFHQF